mgnify:CR=1 FL=1
MGIILASASPRRREIMDKLNLRYKVVVPNIDETLNRQLGLREKIEDLALRKGQAVSRNHPDDVVIAADTVVVVNNRILGKPHGISEARKMLKALSGRTHKVITAVAMIDGGETFVTSDVAYVTFSELDDEEIEKYIQTREPYDKAGGYAIQGWASVFITRMRGSYYTVMGFPLHIVYEYLKQKGFY